MKPSPIRTPCNTAQWWWCPRQESNLRLRLRRATLYPLSYEGGKTEMLVQ